MASENEIRSRNLIRKIDENKHLDLRDRAREIATELQNGTRDTVLKIFWILINLEHAKHYGLGTTYHADREGGWGYTPRDRNFLGSLAGQHMGHVFGIRVSCGGSGSGGYVPNPLSSTQVDWIRRILSRPFYAFQLALVNPGTNHAQPVRVIPYTPVSQLQTSDIPF